MNLKRQNCAFYKRNLTVFFIFSLLVVATVYINKKQDSGVIDTARQIYNVLDQYRITYDIDARSIDSTFDVTPKPATGVAECIKQIGEFVKQKNPINMILVGFPFKSANHEVKTFGALPDMAERKSLEYLQSILNEIKSVYAPGAKITIFCDGIPFASFFGIPYADVVVYEKSLQKLVSDLPDMKLYTSDDFMKEHNYKPLDDITALIDKYPPTDEAYKASAQPVVGIARKRFALELDHAEGQKLLSQKSLDDVVFGLLAREARLRNYLAEAFPATKFLRLTVHFSADVGKKFGIKVSPDSFITPYHGVCVEELDGVWSIQFKKDVNPGQYKKLVKEINGVDCPYFKRFKMEE